MPLHIDIRLNHQLLHTIHIGRLDGGEHPDDVNIYRAVVTQAGEYDIDFFSDDAVEYTHRYGDGADLCIARAIASLYSDTVDIEIHERRGMLDDTVRIPAWFRFSDTPLGPTTPWGIQPFGYHYTGGPIGSTNWVLPNKAPMYVNIFLDEPHVSEDRMNPFPGRITVIADTDNHFEDWTSIASGVTYPSSHRSIGYTRGHALWSAWFSNQEEFIEALRHADSMMRDPDVWLTQAVLTPSAVDLEDETA